MGLTQGKVSEIMKIKLLWLRLRVALVFQSVSSVQTCFAVFFFFRRVSDIRLIISVIITIVIIEACFILVYCATCCFIIFHYMSSNS